MGIHHYTFQREDGVQWGFPSHSDGKESACMIPGSGRSSEKGMATHSSTFVWRIPWTEKPGGLQSMVSQSQTRLSD